MQSGEIVARTGVGGGAGEFGRARTSHRESARVGFITPYHSTPWPGAVVRQKEDKNGDFAASECRNAYDTYRTLGKLAGEDACATPSYGEEPAPFPPAARLLVNRTAAAVRECTFSFSYILPMCVRTVLSAIGSRLAISL